MTLLNRDWALENNSDRSGSRTLKVNNNETKLYRRKNVKDGFLVQI